MKTKPGRLFLPAMVVLLGICVFFACHKENSYSSGNTIPPGKSQLSVFMTDGPYNFQKVLVDIKSVQVLVDTCHRSGDEEDNSCAFGEGDHEGDDNSQGNEDNGDDDHSSHHDTCAVWSDLKIIPGVYDLLTLRNGNDTLLGASFIPNGRIKAIRIVLGTNNSITADSITRPLQICGNSDSVIVCLKKENLDSIAQNNFHLLVDFNLARSIRFNDSVYCIKPLLRVYSERHTGSIEGEVGPDDAFGLIRAINGTDTAYALPDVDEDGEFKIRGLNGGTYSVLVQGINGYKDSTITNVQVTVGEQTKLGKILLHK